MKSRNQFYLVEQIKFIGWPVSEDYTTMGINYLYQRRSFVLWLVDGIYVILGLGIAGMILGAWR